MPFRLAPDQMRDLERAARSCGQTKQAFVESAVLAEIANVKERRREKQVERKELRNANSDSSLAPPTSLLVDTLLRQRRQQESEAPVPTTSAPGQVVVNVGGGPTAAGSEIDRLAAYVMGGSDYERDKRLRTAVDILRATATSDEEKKVLAARLDEVIATKAKTNENGMVRAARVAFDKLTGLFGGNE
jgi:hypothetical protein